MPFTYDYPRPMVTIDCVIFFISKHEKKVLLIQRDKSPYEGRWALPGGFVDMDETLENAAIRELYEETALRNIEITQLYTFGDPGRDPRGRSISIVYYGFVGKGNESVKAGDDARNAKWFSLQQLPELAFDHNEILEFAIRKIKWEESRSSPGKLYQDPT